MMTTLSQQMPWLHTHQEISRLCLSLIAFMALSTQWALLPSLIGAFAIWIGAYLLSYGVFQYAHNRLMLHFMASEFDRVSKDDQQIIKEYLSQPSIQKKIINAFVTGRRGVIFQKKNPSKIKENFFNQNTSNTGQVDRAGDFMIHFDPNHQLPRKVALTFLPRIDGGLDLGLHVFPKSKCSDGSKVSCFTNDANRSQARQREENHHFKTSAGYEKRCEYAVSVYTNNKLPSESVLLSPKTRHSHQVIRIEESKGEDLCRVIHRAATLDTTRGDNDSSVDNATNHTNWTSQKPSLSVNDINAMVKSIASNLRTLHQQGRAHMDLKLANVVINKNAEVSVIDYPDYSQMTVYPPTTPPFCGLQRQHVMLSFFGKFSGAGAQIVLENFKKKRLLLKLDLKPESIEKFRAIRQDFDSVVKDATVSPNGTFHDTWSALYMALSCYAVVNCPRESKVAVQKTFDMMVRMLEDCVATHKKIPQPSILDNTLFTVEGLQRMRMTESKVRARAEMNRLWGMESTISSLVHNIENELSHNQDQASMRATHNSCGQRPWVSRMFAAVWPVPTPIRA